MRKNFAILVGNGFTLDFLDHNKSGLDSSKPLSNFGSPFINYDEFINDMPSIKKHLIEKNGEDFKLIKSFYETNELSSHEFGHLRQFLALSYSKFQSSIEKYNYDNWKWSEWFNKNKSNLLCSISLNYDLVLEKTFDNLDINYFRVGSEEELRGSILLKPHGSIDFDMPSYAIQLNMPKIDRLKSTTYMNDAQYVRILKKEALLYPRVEADIIPPMMDNFQKKMSWIERQFMYYECISPVIAKFVIVGVSYWEVDRPEIDFFLERLPKNSIVYLGAEKPYNNAIKKLIEKLFSLNIEYYTFGFKELPW